MDKAKKQYSQNRIEEVRLKALSLTDANIPDGSVVGETKLGFERRQDFLLDLLHSVTAEGTDL